MRVTQEFIDSIQIPRDNVLLRLDRGNDEVIIGRGTEHETKLFLPINVGNMNEHAPVVGTVAKVPLELTPAHSDNEWVTELEVAEGDRVIVYYMEVVHALGGYQQSSGMFDHTALNFFHTEDGTLYVSIPYSGIYCVITDGGLRPVNGYVIGERIELPKMEGPSGLILNEDLHGHKTHKHYMRHIKVKYVSELKNEYELEIEGRKVYSDDCIVKIEKEGDALSLKNIELEPGQIVYLDNKHRAAPLEYDLHAVAGKDLVYFQRRHVLLVMDEPMIEKDW